jgi:hypothetical protein
MKQELGYYELKNMWKDSNKFSKLESLLGVHNSEWFQSYNEYLEHVAKQCTIGKIIEMIQFIDKDYIHSIVSMCNNTKWTCVTENYPTTDRSSVHEELIDELWSVLLELL